MCGFDCLVYYVYEVGCFDCVVGVVVVGFVEYVLDDVFVGDLGVGGVLVVGEV